MTEVFRFAALGVGAGALYALAAVGLVLVHRGSGVVNFAQGAMGMVGAYVYFEGRGGDLPDALSVVLGLLAAAVLGALFHLLVLRRMRRASGLARIVATLALLVVLQSVAVLRYGDLPKVIPSMLPIEPVSVFGAQIGRDRLYILAIVVVLTAALWAVYRFTRFAVATSAVAENSRSAAALGVSPDLIGAANWAIGAALGALAAILLAPITGLGPANLTYLVIPVLAAAVVGRFASFPITLAAGLVIGIGQSEVTRYVTAPGLATAIPFVLVAVVLLARGRTTAGKGDSFGRMPRLGAGRPHRLATGVAVLAAVACIWWLLPAEWVNAFGLQMIVAIILMSFVVVTGYAGQVSLVQIGFAGVGALMTAWLVADHGWPFWLAALAGVLTVVPVGIVVGLGGLRIRGVHLAILTLGLAISLEAVVFGNPRYTGGVEGYHVGGIRVFGLAVDALTFPKRYASLVLVVLVIVALAIVNLRRSRAGRRLIAVRTNERAAAALGISVVGAKLYAFVLGAMIASFGGILLAFHDPVPSFGAFAGLQSVTALQNAVLGGVGATTGPLVGSSFAPGTLGQQIFSFLGAKVALYLALASGVGLLFMLTSAPDGLVFLRRRADDRLRALVADRLPRRLSGFQPRARRATTPASESATFESATSEVGGGRARGEPGAASRPAARAGAAPGVGALRWRRRVARAEPVRASRRDRGSDRTERRRQEHDDHRFHHPGRWRGASRRDAHRRLEPRTAGARGARPVVPVTGTVRGPHRPGEPAERLRPPGQPRLRHQPGRPGPQPAHPRRLGRGRRLRTRAVPRHAGPGPRLRPPADARGGPRRGGRPQRPAARRAGGRARRRADP